MRTSIGAGCRQRKWSGCNPTRSSQSEVPFHSSGFAPSFVARMAGRKSVGLRSTGYERDLYAAEEPGAQMLSWVHMRKQANGTAGKKPAAPAVKGPAGPEDSTNR